MVIKNNTSAMMALHQANTNINKLSKNLRELSSGMKINSAGDAASEYAISEKMRVRIRALGQCSRNCNIGSDMLDVASQAIDQQVNIFKQIKTVALRASDDTYTDIDRVNLQKEVSQLLDESENIAQTTTFNGQYLLNQRTLTSSVAYFDPDLPYKPNRDAIPVLKQAAGMNYTVPTGQYVEITSGNVFDHTTVIQSGPLTSLPAVGAIIWDDAANTYGPVTEDADGTLKVGSTVIEVTGKSNPPTAAVPATSTNVSNVEHPSLTTLPAVGTKVGTQKSVTAVPETRYVYDVKLAPGTDKLSYFDTSKTSISVMEFDFLDLAAVMAGKTTDDLDGLGFSLTCGGCEQFVTVMFDASSAGVQKYEGITGSPPPLCYSIGVKDVDMTDLANSLMQTILNGVSVANGGSSVFPSTTDRTVLLTSRHDIYFNYCAATNKVTISKNGPTITFMNGRKGDLAYDNSYSPYQTMNLQTDTTSSKYTMMTIPNTTNKALFPRTTDNWDIAPKEDDFPKEWPSGYDGLSEAEKRAKWTEEVWQYPKMVFDLDLNNCVSTREKASQFLDKVDQAIKFILNSNTTVGAEINRLEFTDNNIIIANENLTASESVIRDADMAKTMMEYTKYNVLSQAAQAMLAQANQDSGRTLSLLQ